MGAMPLLPAKINRSAEPVANVGFSEEARSRMSLALLQFKIEGIDTTLELQRFLIDHPRFASGNVNTVMVESVLPELLDR